MAVTILSVAMLPVLAISGQNVRSARQDSVRLVCEMLARTMLEAFGRSEFEGLHLMEPGDDPDVSRAADIWKRDEVLSFLLSDSSIRQLMEYYEVKTLLTLRRNVKPGLHKIISDVSWREKSAGAGRWRRLSYARLYTHEPTLSP